MEVERILATATHAVLDRQIQPFIPLLTHIEACFSKSVRIRRHPLLSSRKVC